MNLPGIVLALRPPPGESEELLSGPKDSSEATSMGLPLEKSCKLRLLGSNLRAVALVVPFQGELPSLFRLPNTIGLLVAVLGELSPLIARLPSPQGGVRRKSLSFCFEDSSETNHSRRFISMPLSTAPMLFTGVLPKAVLCWSWITCSCASGNSCSAQGSLSFVCAVLMSWWCSLMKERIFW